ncbi:AAA family ATPase [Fusibacter ferrireducens]|uniref:AAA family ATPase n=1 Tax=Fusibacter ferrireducens TaxID=2785058 RepID=A0ABR9ZRM5_9FIRM|nr:AAA family ATPase [Fusibacter ferrireducens]MBF4692284.1 AAA family ATPase [Fusibacter ferrireducens]
MKNNKIIAVWGNPDSGKTTFSIKMANELIKKNKSVILVMADSYVPAIHTVLPFTETKDQSLGALLSSIQISQESILKKCIPVPNTKNLSILSYLHGENIRTYADYGKERVLDFFILLKHLADHIIVDCSSQFHHDLLSRGALELSDQVIRLISPDLKAISFYDASLPLLGEKKYNVANHIKVLSDVKSEMPKDSVGNRFGGIQKELDHCEELQRQMLEARLFEPLTDKKSEGYNTQLQNLMDALFFSEEVYENKEKNPLKKNLRKIGFFKKEVMHK